MKATLYILTFIFSIAKSGYAQNDIFTKGGLDSLGNKVGFHIQFLDARFLACDSINASYKNYVYFHDDKPLKHFSIPPKFIKHYNLNKPKAKKAGDSILLLDGRFSFSHKRKADSLEFQYNNGFLIYEKFVSRKNKPTIFIPSFKVTPNYEFYTEERFYTKKYNDYFPSYYFEFYIVPENKKTIDKQKLYIYYDGKNWREVAQKQTD